MNEKYIPELEITESDVKTETDREKLKSYKRNIQKDLIGLKTANQAKKNIDAFNKQKIYQYFLNLIAWREAELNEMKSQTNEAKTIREDKEIISELKKHVSKEVFLDIVRKVKAKLNGNG